MLLQTENLKLHCAYLFWKIKSLEEVFLKVKDPLPQRGDNMEWKKKKRVVPESNVDEKEAGNESPVSQLRSVWVQLHFLNLFYITSPS